MSKKRKPEEDYRVKFSIRLPRWMLQELEKLGTRTKIIENALEEYLKKKK